MDRKTPKAREEAGIKPSAERNGKKQDRPSSGSGNGSWQKIEALRERAALKASLADVWDEDFDLDEEILAELDHNAEFFTTQEEEPEEIPDDDGAIDEFYEDDDV